VTAGHAPRREPTGTYRLQVTADFPLADAAAVAGYLADLGASHAYSSPLLRSATGSTHGYDTVDHAHVDEPRGGREGLDRFVAALHEHGLGLVLDIVPNHMGVADPVGLIDSLTSTDAAARGLLTPLLRAKSPRPGIASPAPSTRAHFPLERPAPRRRERSDPRQPALPGAPKPRHRDAVEPSRRPRWRRSAARRCRVPTDARLPRRRP